MSKAQTIAALKRSAIENFAEHGFEGASLRTIASNAGVPLSAVHIYFGSKSELYAAVGQQTWQDLQQERVDIYLSRSRARPDGVGQISDLVHALAYPVARRAMSDSPYDAAEIRIIRSVVWPRHTPSENLGSEMGDNAIEYWIDQLQALCPTLSHGEVVWAYSFVVGAIYSWQLVDHRYDRFLDRDGLGTLEEVVDAIVAFGCSGIEAMAARPRERTARSRPAALV